MRKIRFVKFVEAVVRKKDSASSAFSEVNKRIRCRKYKSMKVLMY